MTTAIAFETKKPKSKVTPSPVSEVLEEPVAQAVTADTLVDQTVAVEETDGVDNSVRNLIIGTIVTALFVGAMHALPYAIEFGSNLYFGSL